MTTDGNPAHALAEGLAALGLDLPPPITIG